MRQLDGSAARPASSAEGRVRPSGWSPGTGSLIGAWLASAAIARLTGATAVILVLAATLVTIVFEAVSGWWSTRSIRIRSILVPSVANVGEEFSARLSIDGPTSTRWSDRRRITLQKTDTTVLSIGDAAAVEGTHDTTVTVRVETPGVLDALRVEVRVSGPGGLIWWKRSSVATIEPLHIAPRAIGPLCEIEVSTSTTEGSVASRRGSHVGEIDGIRPWRPGDSMASVHWASSLRTDELIVHDRVSATDARWIVALDTADPGRLRWTLDEGRRLGHDVAVREADGTLHRVLDDVDAARWSAIAARTADDRAAQRRPATPRSGILHRQIRLRSTPNLLPTTITGPARWSAAAAAFASMAMLAGAIGVSAATLVLVLVAVVVGAIVSLWVARHGGRRPAVMQAMIVAAVLIALMVIVRGAADVDGVLAALRGPLPNVLMLLVVLHGFETVDRRTLRVHLAITFVLASYAAGLSIDRSIGWWLAAWGTAFVASLLTSSRTPDSRVDGSRRAARPRPSMAGSARLTARRVASLATIGAVTLGVLSLVPIPDGPARLGLPALSVNAPTVESPGALGRPDGSTAGADGATDRAPGGAAVGYPGFTQTLDTSVRGDLGDEIVMRVRAPEPAFWRGQTFTEFDGRTWTVSPALGQRRDGPVIEVPPTLGDALGSAVPSRELVQTFFVEQDLPNLVFAASRPVQVIFDGALWTRPDGALRSDVTLTAGSVYTVISERVQVDAEILRAQGDLGTFYAGFRETAGGEELEPFLALPDSTTRRTIDLATSLRMPGASTYDTILAYEAWLGANTRYDLDAPVPAAGADAVDDFLFESRLGFCEQIASALTIMLRSQGVPARLATGYVPGERDRLSGVWNVKGSDAHAWVEVWFPQTGWQAFDPTAEVPLAAEAGGDTVGGDLIGAALSSIAAFRVEIVVVLLAAAATLAAFRLVALARHRRRRGRWGLLQDRFSRLADPTVLPGPVPDRTVGATNPQIAASIIDDRRRAEAHTVADELDRAAFDPTWRDDDERFEQTRSALATLERGRR